MRQAAWEEARLHMQAPDAERERTVEELQFAYAAGWLVLSPEEFDARVARVYQARTYGQLDFLKHGIVGPNIYSPSGQPPRPQPPTNSNALVSLACGVGGLFTGVLAIPAIVLGHMARREIRRTNERGDSMAVRGLVLGYVGTVLMLVVVALVASGA
jgi:hypothetical protein